MEPDCQTDSLTEGTFTEYLQYIHGLTGITVGRNRKAMLQGRFRKRIRELGLPGYAEYLEFVKDHPEERQTFVDLITTNETYFLRTPRIWDYISKELLPAWHALHSSETFKAWSAAASSGEEASTLGVLCQEYQDRKTSFSYRILGTDISSEMVELCRLGRYSGRSIEAFRKAHPELFQKHLVPSEGGHELASRIRSRMQFKVHNLFQKPVGNGEYHLVLLRNVLIYFTPEDQEKVLKHIHASLVPGGVLVIGESESLGNLNTPFERVAPLIYRRASADSFATRREAA
jgi:chemotaxis protein methyltransferase CheR